VLLIGIATADGIPQSKSGRIGEGQGQKVKKSRESASKELSLLQSCFLHSAHGVRLDRW
jgi:hypothetical protein